MHRNFGSWLDHTFLPPGLGSSPPLSIFTFSHFALPHILSYVVARLNPSLQNARHTYLCSAKGTVYVAAERRILEEGIKRFPHFDKLSLMRGQLEARAGHREAAKAAYQAGLRRCIHSAPLWTSLARLEENAGNLARARVYLEQARLKNPGNELIWLAAVRTELRADRKKEAESLLAKALQVSL